VFLFCLPIKNNNMPIYTHNDIEYFPAYYQETIIAPNVILEDTDDQSDMRPFVVEVLNHMGYAVHITKDNFLALSHPLPVPENNCAILFFRPSTTLNWSVMTAKSASIFAGVGKIVS